MSGGLDQARNSDVDGFREQLGIWADGVAEYLGRGQDVVELNLRPESLEAEAWEILGRGLQWKASRQRIYQRGMVVGGDPEAGEPHGFFYNNGVQAVALLRNPSPTPKELSFQLPLGLRGSLRMVQTYPRLRQEAEILKGRSIINTMMEGHETRVMELMPEKSQDLALPFNIDFAPLSSFLDSSDAELNKVRIKVFPESSEIFFSRPQTISALQIEGQSVSLDSLGKAELQMNERVRRVVQSRELLNSKKAEVGIYARRGAQLTLPEWPGVTSALIALFLQPKEGESPSPLYVTVDRKQLVWKTHQTLAPEFGTKVWKIFTTPLEFQKQALLDWAVKDTQETALYLWWIVQAPRPSLEISYTAPVGESKEIFSRLLSSPRSGQYVVNIALEAENRDGKREGREMRPEERRH
jgi:hypothetical protein